MSALEDMVSCVSALKTRLDLRLTVTLPVLSLPVPHRGLAAGTHSLNPSYQIWGLLLNLYLLRHLLARSPYV